MKNDKEFAMKALLSVVDYLSQIGRIPKAKTQGEYVTEVKCKCMCVSS